MQLTTRISTVFAYLALALSALTMLLNRRESAALAAASAIEILALLYFIYELRRKNPAEFDASSILLCFVPIALLSGIAFYTSTVISPIEYWQRFLCPIAVVFIMSRIFYVNERAIEIAVVVFLGALLLAAYATYESSKAAELAQGWKRQTNWGDAVGAVAPLTLLLKNRWVKTAFIAVALAALIVSLKRSGFAVALIIALCALLPFRVQVFAKSRKALIFVSSLAGAVGLIYYLAPLHEFSAYWDMLTTRLSRISQDGGSGRAELWSFGYSIAAEANSFQMMFGRGFGWYHENWQGFNSGIESFHNDLFEVWIAFGAAGLLLYLTFLVRLAFIAIRVAMLSGAHAGFALSVFLVFLVYSLLAGTFYYYFFFPPLFVAIAILEALNRNLATSGRSHHSRPTEPQDMRLAI